MSATLSGTAYLYALELARKEGPEAIKALIKLLKSKDERVQLAAANAILDRGYGRPAQHVEHSGAFTHEHIALSAVDRWLEETLGAGGKGDTADARAN